MRAGLRGMGWNLLWFIPVAGGLLKLTVIEATYACGNGLILLHHRPWAFPFSPSAGVWLAANFVLVSAPIKVLFFVPGLFDRSGEFYSRRYRNLAWCAAVFVALMMVLQVVDWGSFPLVRGPGGSLYVRMIPFL